MRAPEKRSTNGKNTKSRKKRRNHHGILPGIFFRLRKVCFIPHSSTHNKFSPSPLYHGKKHFGSCSAYGASELAEKRQSGLNTKNRVSKHYCYSVHVTYGPKCVLPVRNHLVCVTVVGQVTLPSHDKKPKLMIINPDARMPPKPRLLESTKPRRPRRR